MIRAKQRVPHLLLDVSVHGDLHYDFSHFTRISTTPDGVLPPCGRRAISSVPLFLLIQRSMARGVHDASPEINSQVLALPHRMAFPRPGHHLRLPLVLLSSLHVCPVTQEFPSLLRCLHVSYAHRREAIRPFPGITTYGDNKLPYFSCFLWICTILLRNSYCSMP